MNDSIVRFEGVRERIRAVRMAVAGEIDKILGEIDAHVWDLQGDPGIDLTSRPETDREAVQGEVVARRLWEIAASMVPSMNGLSWEQVSAEGKTSLRAQGLFVVRLLAQEEQRREKMLSTLVWATGDPGFENLTPAVKEKLLAFLKVGRQEIDPKPEEERTA